MGLNPSSSKMISILFVFFFPLVSSDLCNYHATLFENEPFYLTQPYEMNISINLENYKTTFEKLPSKIEKFSQILELYSNDTAIDQHEPIELYPFSEEANAFRTKTKVTGKDAFKACAENNGSLVALTPENKPYFMKLMHKLGLDEIPFTALPFQNLLSYPNLELLDGEVSHLDLEKIWSESPPFLKKADGSYKYPAKRDASTEPPTETTKAPPSLQYALCVKPNNPWDLKESRTNWLKLVPQLKNSLKLLSTLKLAYKQTANTLRNLPQNPVSEAVDLIKLVLPDPLKSVYDFIDKFSSKTKWELTSPSALKLFSDFARNALRLVRLFKLDSQSFTSINKKTQKSFRLLNFNDLHWKNFFNLDEEVFGISGPVSVTPFSSIALNADSDPDPVIFEATVRFRIFDREKDKFKHFLVKPNIVNGKIVRINQIRQSSTFTWASAQDLSPLDCHRQPTELYKICHRLSFPTLDSLPLRLLSKCGNALITELHNSDHSNCPLAYPPSDPIIYRADCDQDGHSSVIISSTKPLQLAFICDSKLESTRNFSNFPERIKTDCEVRQLTMGSEGIVVPQTNPDFEQDPILGPTVPFIHPAPLEPFDYLLFVGTPVVSGLALIIIIFILICCCCKYCKCCKKPIDASFELGPPVPSTTFQRSVIRSRSAEALPAPVGYPLLE